MQLSASTSVNRPSPNACSSGSQTYIAIPHDGWRTYVVEVLGRGRATEWEGSDGGGGGWEERRVEGSLGLI
jgi:hypothetical protein